MKNMEYVASGRLRRLTFLSAFLLPLWLLAQPRPDQRRAHVEITTDLGTIVIELYNQTPEHRDNFIKLVQQGHYDSLLFHRVIPGLAIQGGDPRSRNAVPSDENELGDCSNGPTLPSEIIPGLIHKRGALAAAREDDDKNPDHRSDHSQFYIVHGRKYQPEDLERIEKRNERYGTPHEFSEAEKELYATVGGAPHLDGNYTVFGHVVEGMDVVDRIAMLPVDRNDRPVQDIRMFMRLR